MVSTPSESKFRRLRQLAITVAMLAAVTGLGLLFRHLAFTEANIITIYILGVLLTALFTRSYLCSSLASLASVLLFNFFFTEPRLTFHAYETGYPVTFAIMLLAGLITGTLANRAADHARQSAEAAALAENEKLRADLLRTISHDLRTPLTSISGNAENLLTNDALLDPETRRTLLSDIHDDSIWLIQLVENLLSVTRMSDGQTPLRLSAQLVDDVVLEALRHVRRKQHTHTIQVDLPDDLLLAQMDARLISQVLVNLVDNALKYTPPGSTIGVTAYPAGQMVAIQVWDDGDGIPDEKKAQVFEMFYTGAGAVADCRRSLGLGLALCRSIVRAHGGKITLTDRRPHGAVFTFTLPASPLPAET